MAKPQKKTGFNPDVLTDDLKKKRVIDAVMNETGSRPEETEWLSRQLSNWCMRRISDVALVHIMIVLWSDIHGEEM